MLSAQNAYKTLMDIGGLETEAEYGYDGEDEGCKFNRSKVAVRVSGGVEISEDEEEMAKWLLENGPISIALNAFAMQFYMGGVCTPYIISTTTIVNIKSAIWLLVPAGAFLFSPHKNNNM